MKILLDTQIFLWIFIEPERFSTKARQFIQNSESGDFFLSDVSAWEASIKFGLGKLHLPESPETFFASRVRRADYRRLRIDLDHVTKVHKLPLVHRDPFDRLLVSQAIVEKMTVLSDDRIFQKYDIKTLSLSDIS
jgi:PIN domain nuclease of toxin-antitoxin system